jgi:enoyl-CoA hydratase
MAVSPRGGSLLERIKRRRIISKQDGASDEVLVERSGRVGKIILNKPQTLNALSHSMMAKIAAALADFELDDSIHVVIIKGNGRAFCSGMEISDVADEHHDVSAHVDRRNTNKLGFWFQRNLWEFSKPTILQIKGYCYAGAGYFMSFCDLVVADEKTMIGAPENRAFGLEPSLGMWPLTIGLRWTKALVLTGDSIDAVTAERIGMINKAVPLEDLDEYTDWLAEKIAKTNLPLLSLHKQTLNMVFDVLGAYPMLKAGLVFDHMEHRDSEFNELLGRAKKYGAKAAFDWVYEKSGGVQRTGDPSFLDGPPKKNKKAPPAA